VASSRVGGRRRRRRRGVVAVLVALEVQYEAAEWLVPPPVAARLHRNGLVARQAARLVLERAAEQVQLSGELVPAGTERVAEALQGHAHVLNMVVSGLLHLHVTVGFLLASIAVEVGHLDRCQSDSC